MTQTMDNAMAGKHDEIAGAGQLKLRKRIGSTEYIVSVRFSESAKETLEEKILRLIESEVRKSA
ncbi:MAG: transposon-encoded TnpW family protein [Acidaminococcales bacterium]|jgi:hypothetical protein|nr:transposon-encoded TnpW family protein [Acidaminococcales bacterium]